MKLRKGEKLAIDTKSQYEERGNIIEVWATERAVGEFLFVQGDEVWVDFLPEESGVDGVYEGKATGYTHEDYIIGSLSRCKTHDVDNVYHDKEEEWFCPFCKEDEQCQRN